MNLPVSPELMSLATYVAEDGLVGHHWKERPIGFICLNRGTPGPRSGSGWLGEQRGGRVYGMFGIAFVT